LHTYCEIQGSCTLVWLAILVASSATSSKQLHRVIEHLCEPLSEDETFGPQELTHTLDFILSADGPFHFCPDMFDLSRDLTLSSCRSRSFHRFAPTRVRYIESFLCALPTVHAANRAPVRVKRASSSPYTATEIPYLHHHHCMVPIRDAF
jgi:hypothetical protein